MVHRVDASPGPTLRRLRRARGQRHLRARLCAAAAREPRGHAAKVPGSPRAPRVITPGGPEPPAPPRLSGVSGRGRGQGPLLTLRIRQWLRWTPSLPCRPRRPRPRCSHPAPWTGLLAVALEPGLVHLFSGGTREELCPDLCLLLGDRASGCWAGLDLGLLGWGCGPCPAAPGLLCVLASTDQVLEGPCVGTSEHPTGLRGAGPDHGGESEHGGGNAPKAAALPSAAAGRTGLPSLARLGLTGGCSPRPAQHPETWHGPWLTRKRANLTTESAVSAGPRHCHATLHGGSQAP